MAEIEALDKAAKALLDSNFTTAFTGAGISVESGIPSFRGDGGLWSRYDPKMLEFSYFLERPEVAWPVIREIFYQNFDQCKPNPAHLVLARMEQNGKLGRIITQNIDNLHQEAGSRMVYEFHGNAKNLICLHCYRHYRKSEVSLDHIPPTCRECGGALRPGFVFFGEGIPRQALAAAQEASEISDVFLIIGTTGEVMPANQFPVLARANGALIIEINPEESLYTSQITHIFLRGKAGEIMRQLEERLFPPSLNND